MDAINDETIAPQMRGDGVMPFVVTYLVIPAVCITAGFLTAVYTQKAYQHVAPDLATVWKDSANWVGNIFTRKPTIDIDI